MKKMLAQGMANASLREIVQERNAIVMRIGMAFSVAQDLTTTFCIIAGLLVLIRKNSNITQITQGLHFLSAKQMNKQESHSSEPTDFPIIFHFFSTIICTLGEMIKNCTKLPGN